MALAIVVSACEKPEQSVGIDLQPDEDLFGVGFTDTLTVSAQTLREDSLRSDGVSPALIGAYTDPVFGFSKAVHNTEVRLTSTNPNFFEEGTGVGDIIIDSLILSLHYDVPVQDDESDIEPGAVYGGYGKQYFQVFALAENLSADSSYYTNRIADILPEDLVEPGFNLLGPNPEDSVMVGGELEGPQLRIRLQNQLAEDIVAASADDGLSTDEFQDLLKGIQITVDENAPGVDLTHTGIVRFQTLSGRSAMTMYYRNLHSNDTLQYRFEIRSNTGKYNYFEHDYASAENELYEQVVNENYLLADQRLYVQAMGGVKIKLKFPTLTSLRDSTGLAVSGAQLILPVSGVDEFIPPNGLFIFGIDEEGRSFLLDDRPISGGFNGALYDSEKKEFRFDIPRYIQQVISGDREPYGLEIVSEKASFSPRRVVIQGPGSTDKHMKINLILTKY